VLNVHAVLFHTLDHGCICTRRGTPLFAMLVRGCGCEYGLIVVCGCGCGCVSRLKKATPLPRFWSVYAARSHRSLRSCVVLAWTTLYT